MKQEMEDWEGLVGLVINKMIQRSRGLFKFRDDLVGVGYLGLAKAIETYDGSRGMTKVSYYSLKIRGFVKDYIKKETKRLLPTIDINSIDSVSPSAEELVLEKEEPKAPEHLTLVSLLEPTDKIDRRVYNDLILNNYLTQREVAEELGVDVSMIKWRKRRLIKRFRTILTGGNLC